MTHRLLLLVAAVVAALSPALAAPAGAQAPAIEILSVDTAQSPSIEVNVAVPPDLDGAALTPASFSVIEGGVPVPVEATKLQTMIDVVLVVDTSGSMAGAPMDAARAAAIDFLGRMDPTTRVAVLGFGAVPTVASELGVDREASRAAIEALVPRGETALWDALVAAAGLEQDRDLYVVLLSDGGDTVSAAPAEQAVSALRDRGIPLYALNISTSESDRDGLTAVVDQVGGLSLNADDPSGLGPMYDQVAAQLSKLWRLRFDAVGAGPERLEVTATAGASSAHGAIDVVLAEPPTTTTAPAPPVEAPTPAEPPPASSEVAPSPGLFAAAGMLWVGAGLVGASLLIAALLVGRPSVPRLRLTKPNRDDGQLKRRIVDAADRAISPERRGRIDVALERADQDLKASELVVVVAAGTVTTAAVGFALLGPLGFALGAAVPLMARMWLARLATRRHKQFAEQLPDTLLILSASLRSGRALSQALEMLAKEAPEPSASEFGRVVIEARIGRDLIESLERMAERTASDDFDWVVRAIAINRELGGDLAEVLDNVGETIRDRAQVQRHVRSLSAEGRLSAWILLGLPIFVGLVVSQTNAGYLNLLFTRTAGQVAVAAGLAMFAIGGLWIRRIVDLKY